MMGGGGSRPAVGGAQPRTIARRKQALCNQPRRWQDGKERTPTATAAIPSAASFGRKETEALIEPAGTRTGQAGFIRVNSAQAGRRKHPLTS